jgi:hypothetical protein
MLLGNKESIEIPETGLDEAVCRHLLKSHLEEDLPKLGSDLVKRMQGTCILVFTESFEIVGLKIGCLPCTTAYIRSEI